MKDAGWDFSLWTEKELLALHARLKADLTAGKTITNYTAPGGLAVGKTATGNPRELLNAVTHWLKAKNPDLYGYPPASRTVARFN